MCFFGVLDCGDGRQRTQSQIKQQIFSSNIFKLSRSIIIYFSLNSIFFNRIPFFSFYNIFLNMILCFFLILYNINFLRSFFFYFFMIIIIIVTILQLFHDTIHIILFIKRIFILFHPFFYLIFLLQLQKNYLFVYLFVVTN